MRELNGFWLSVSSCLPGCGQMYQGYMKRGASLLLLFWSMVAVSSILQLNALSVFIAAIWLYAFFDSYNIRALCKEGRPAQDCYLFAGNDESVLCFLKGKGRKILGWTLIVIGAYALLEVCADTLGNTYGWWGLSEAMNGIVPKTILTILIIWLGVWFIRGPKQKSDDSFAHYTPNNGAYTDSTTLSSPSEEGDDHE
ncbi:MAG: hypothetical protein ACOX66_00900 [Oscillospiraceae bacterium]|jgi:hypothetical protein